MRYLPRRSSTVTGSPIRLQEISRAARSYTARMLFASIVFSTSSSSGAVAVSSSTIASVGVVTSMVVCASSCMIRRRYGRLMLLKLIVFGIVTSPPIKGTAEL